MGSLCSLCRKKRVEDQITEPLFKITIGDGEMQNNDNKDLKEKKELAIFLIQNDYKIFSLHLDEVKNLNDEQFSNLFKGNTDYNNYKTSNPKGFLQLVQKFEDNYELISEWYSNKNYYNIILPIWKANIIQNLKGKEENEQERILKDRGIDISLWDADFRNHFKSIISTSQLKTAAERIKNYIANNFGDFDEYIKLEQKCKKKVEENEKSICGKYLTTDLDTSMYSMLKLFLPAFFKKYNNDLDNLSSDIKKNQENAAIKKMIKAGMTETKSKALLKELMKKYEEEKYTGTFDYKEELNEVNDFTLKFSKGEIKELNFKESSGIVFQNNMVKHAILGFSLINLSYGILHISKLLFDYKNLNIEIRRRLDEIAKSFELHKGQVANIPKNDIDAAAEFIKKLNKAFNDDKENLQNLIKDIKGAIENQVTERNKSIFQLITSGISTGIGIFGAIVTKGKDRIEYTSSSLAEILTVGISALDIALIQKRIKELDSYLSEANNLEEKIRENIEDLRKKFEELKTKHWA